MAKGYTSFSAGFLGAEAVATKPIGNMKYLDWDKVKTVVAENPKATIRAGLQEDWNNTSGVIFAQGNYYDGGCVYGSSKWATPIVDVDGMEIECYKDSPNEWGSGMPRWWGDGAEVLDSYDFEDDFED